jgi:SAM-dependent methyltransferase
MAGQNWWDEETGFFGEFYIRGDNSLHGHLARRRQSLDARTRSEVEGVVRLLRLQAHSRILDVPCGYGRHAIALSLLGHQVTGADINEAHLRHAREAARRAGANPAFVRADMLTIDAGTQFDVVINMFYSFGFFDTDALNAQVLANFRKALKPGGKFLMHTDVNLARIRSGRYKTHERRELEGGGELQIEERYDLSTHRMEGSWTVTLDGVSTRKNYSVRVYEDSEFRQLCLDAGFRNCTSFGGWDGGPCGTDDEEIVFIATR